MQLPNPDFTPNAFSSLQAQHSMAAILDAIDALVYVSDMETHEILFINQYGRNIWGNVQGQLCWRSLQAGQKGPCSVCTNTQLIDENGTPTDVLVWEFQNTVNGRWYQCRDQAIPWVTGKLARIEIATDITDLKNNVLALEEARQRAEDLCRIDALTGCKNRRTVADEAQLLFNLANRYPTDLVVVMIDLDHFKIINDQYGHAKGDVVLQQVAKTIEHHIREVDILGRWGGEEFVLLLPGMRIEQAVTALERLRIAVSELAFPSEQGAFGITASFGAAAHLEQHTTFDAALAQADQALYQAKSAGRNRVETANPAANQPR